MENMKSCSNSKATQYHTWTCKQLRNELKERQASATGRKAELIARLCELDSVQKPRKRKGREIEVTASKKIKRKNNEMSDAVREMLQCPICFEIMSGQINQVKR